MIKLKLRKMELLLIYGHVNAISKAIIENKSNENST